MICLEKASEGNAGKNLDLLLFRLRSAFSHTAQGAEGILYIHHSHSRYRWPLAPMQYNLMGRGPAQPCLRDG